VQPTLAKYALLLALLPGVAASAAECPRILSFWPLFHYKKEATRTELEVLGPLFFYQKGPEATTYGLRPLFSFRHEAESQKKVWHFLYPLSYFRSEPQATSQYVFLVYTHYRRIAPNGRPASATFVWPLVWWGESPKGGRWLYSPLVGGTLKGLFGADEIVYHSITHIRTRTGDYVTHHYLWPLFTSSRGPDRRVLRIWPFYGYGKREGRWWSGFVLWPFFTYGQREASEHKSAADYFCFFPFFGRARARDGRSGSYQVLWPLFYYAWNERKNFREWRMPFPIHMGKRSDDVQTLNLWPFWGRRRYKTGTDTYVLWPLIHTSRVRSKNTRRDTLRVFPFFTRVSSENKKRSTRRSYWAFWPLWRSRSRQAGDERWGDANSIQLAWFRDSEAFDRNYNALFGLFEHEARRDGRRSTHLLWRLLRWERGPGWRRFQLGPLASWSRSDGLTRASFMLGLVQTGTRDGKRGWRIFFVPFGARLSEPSHPPAEEQTRGE